MGCVLVETPPGGFRRCRVRAPRWLVDSRGADAEAEAPVVGGAGGETTSMTVSELLAASGGAPSCGSSTRSLVVSGKAVGDGCTKISVAL